jgi:hypothetical protein
MAGLSALLALVAAGCGGAAGSTSSAAAAATTSAAAVGCGPPTGVWHRWCDIARSSPINVAVANPAGAKRCPAIEDGLTGGVKAYDVVFSGHTPNALLCALENGSYWLSSFSGGSPAVGVVNTTTCASVEFTSQPITGSGSSAGWCRLPRSAACPACLAPHPGPSPPPPPLPPPPPQPAKTPTVLAFYMGDVGAPSYWLDYDWSILTHIVLYGWNDPNMISYAKARNVKLLQTFNGCSGKDLSKPSVRAEVIRDAMTRAPIPYGKRPVNTSMDGLL